MTTHEQHPEMLDTTPDMNQGPMDQGRMDQGRMNQDPMDQGRMDQQPMRDEPVGSAPAAVGTEQTLFADGEMTDLRSRWTEVQAAFVDDPRDCVQKADGLVSDVVDKLTAGFGQVRSQLEEQWGRGEEASTEDLRVALQRYRDFFERLLAV